MAERNVVMQILLHSPKDTVAVAIAVVTVCAIMGNALFFQTGRHPAPMFGMALPVVAPPVAAPATRPAPRPVATETRQPQPRAEAPATPAGDPLTNLVKETTAASNSTRPSPARRISAVQSALARYGFGQVSTTGTYTPETRKAIKDFEKTHNMPVTGQASDRLVSELSRVLGEPIE